MPTTKLSSYRLLHRGVEELSRVEANGIRVDTKYLDKAIRDVGARMVAIEAGLKRDKFWRVTWRKVFGPKAKITSLEQLGHLVFDRLGHPVLERTETGRPKTDEAAFEHVDIPFVHEHVRLRKLTKLRNTYLKGIKREVRKGLLHPVFSLHLTETYRSSSDTPNFQNLPIRNKEMGEIVRRCFVARKGRHLVEVDFSGIEVRVAACYNHDPVLIKYIKDPSTDMHRDTAAELFLITLDFLKEHKDWAKKTVRDWSKNRFVFPQFYGSVYFQCAPHIWKALNEKDKDGKFLYKLPDGTPVIQHLRKKGIKELGRCDPKSPPKKGTFEYHVKQVEDSFWNKRFKVYTAWKKRVWWDYRDRGGFRTHTGFWIEGVYRRNQVLNYPIQGSAFHCLLQSLVWLQEEIRRRGMKTLIVGQIHDSIIADVPPDEIQAYLTLARRVMTEQLPKRWKWINVPLEVEADVAPVGKSWFHKEEWVKNDDGRWGPKGG